MDSIQAALSSVKEELKSVVQNILKHAENGEDEKSFTISFLLSQKEQLERNQKELQLQLERKEKELQLERKEKELQLQLERKEKELQLERKEKELQLERKEKEEELENRINERVGKLRALFLEGTGEDDPYVRLLKEEKKEFERQLALLWESRLLVTGSQQEESMHKLGEGLTKLGETQAEVLQLLQSKQTLKANISQPCSEIQDALLRTCELVCSVEGEAVMAESGVRPSVQFRQFEWPQEDEEKDSAYACEHFEEELKKFGVKFGRGGWKLIDVRNDKTFLSIQVGNIVLGGTTDAVIVPYKVTRETAAMTVRVVLEWKLPRYSDWASCKGQGLAELIAAYAHSNSPLIVVVTDLQSRFHILEPSVGDAGNPCIARFLDMDPRQAMVKIAGFLATVSPHADYLLDKDAGAAESACARVSKRIKQTIPENPLAQILSLADFLPPCEREQLIWEALGSQHLWSRSSEVPPTMYG